MKKLLLAAVLLCAVCGAWGVDMTKDTNITTTSSYDGITLYLDLAYATSGGPFPTLIVIQGWNATKSDFMTDAWRQRLVNYGVSMITINTRGKGSSGGSRDATGLEPNDIVDALKYVLANYSSKFSSAKIGLVGYSGGGGLGMSVLEKHPDRIGFSVLHFGQPDLSLWYSTNGPQYTDISNFVGGTPAQVPNNYEARNSIHSIANNPTTKIFWLHDTGDAYVNVRQIDSIRTHITSNSLTNWTTIKTTADSTVRAIHGYPIAGYETGSAVDSLFETTQYPTWMTDFLENTYNAPTALDSGTYRINGYIDTKKFRVEIENAKDYAANLVYNLTKKTFAIINNITNSSGSIKIKLYSKVPGQAYKATWRNNTKVVYSVAASDSSLVMYVPLTENTNDTFTIDTSSRVPYNFLDSCKLKLAMTAWGKGTGTVAKASGTIPSYPNGAYQPCSLYNVASYGYQNDGTNWGLKFDGSSTKLTTTYYGQAGRTKLTVMAWVKIFANNNKGILGQDQNGIGRSWCWTVGSDQQKLSAYWFDGTSTKKLYKSAKTVTDSLVHCVVTVYNAGTIEMWIDGAKENVTKTTDDTISTLYYNASLNFLLGFIYTNSFSFNGWIYDVDIREKALDSNEIKAYYNRGITGSFVGVNNVRNMLLKNQPKINAVTQVDSSRNYKFTGWGFGQATPTVKIAGTLAVVDSCKDTAVYVTAALNTTQGNDKIFKLISSDTLSDSITDTVSFYIPPSGPTITAQPSAGLSSAFRPAYRTGKGAFRRSWR